MKPRSIVPALLCAVALASVCFLVFRPSKTSPPADSARASGAAKSIAPGPPLLSTAPDPAPSPDSGRAPLSPAAVAKLRQARPDVRWQQPVEEPAFASFKEWTERFTRGEAAEAEGIQLASARRAELAELIRKNPERALELAVPGSVRRQLSAAVVALLEQPLNGRGDLAVMAAVPEPGQAPVRPANSRYATIGGETYNAHVFGRRLGHPSRWNIPLHGIAIGRDAAFEEPVVRVLEAGEAAAVKAGLPIDPLCSISGQTSTVNHDEFALDTGTGVTFLCSAEHATRLAASLDAGEDELPPGAGATGKGGTTSDYGHTGTRTILLIRVDFPDYPGGSMTDTEATNALDAMAVTFSNWSYGRLIVPLAGAGSDVTPVLRMPQSNSLYNGNDGLLRTHAWTAATNAGFPPSAYYLDAVCFAGNTPNWGYGGLASVGGRGVWLHTTGLTNNAGIGTHEFGHNFGLNHANYYNAPFGMVIYPGGSNDEYGDPFDTMGSASTNNNFSARQKQYLGWLTNGPSGIEWTNLGSGLTTSRIYAHDVAQAAGLLKGLRVTRDTGLNNDKEYYWVEFRTQDNNWLDNGAGLRWAGSGNERPQLLDTTPESVDGKDDSPILIGRTFTDTNYGIHITPIDRGGGTPQWLDVVVNFGQFTNNDAPTVGVSASATNAVTGVALNFTATASDPDGDDLAYFWNFGDGSVGNNNQTNISHSWSSAGEYVVQCTVTDMKGKIAAESVLVRIGNPSTYRIAGTVLLDGQPAPGVRVAVGTARVGYTDSDGSYLLTGFSAGTNAVGATVDGHVFIPAWGTSATEVLGESNTTGIVDFIGGVPLAGGYVNRTMNWNATNGPMLFWTFDYESTNTSLVMDGFSGNTNLMPDSGFIFSTTGTNRLLNLRPATNAAGTVTNFIVVTDPSGTARTNTFVLTINQPPAVTTTSVTTNEDMAVDIDLWARTTDSNPVSTADSNVLFTVGSPSNGAVTLISNRYAQFTPAMNYSGPASFAFTAIDKGYDPGLLLYYDFDSGQSNDRSGNARTATLDRDGTGAYALVTNVAPPALAPFDLVALELTDNGNSNSARLYRTIRTAEYNLNNADWTFACWFRRDSSTNDDLLFHIGPGDAQGNDGQELYAYLASGNNAVRLRHYNASNVLDLNLTTPATVLTSQWHHVAVTFDRTNSSIGDFKLYHNGSLVASSNGIALNMAQTNIVFGGHDHTNNTHRWLNGALDEIGLWKVALTSNDIAELTTTTIAHFGGLSRGTNIALTFTAVNDPPTLANIGNYVILEDTSTSSIPLTIGDIETATSNLIVTASSSNPDLVPNSPANLVLGGSNASRTLIIFPATNGNGDASITVTLSDGTTTTNRMFTLTVSAVNDPPALLNLPTKYTHPGVTVSFALPASDVDLPSNTLSFNLLSPPAGASVNAATGLLTWSPDESQLGPWAINATVTDNGTPNLSAANSYSVVVLETLTSNSVSLLNDDWVITWNSIPGRTYRVQFKNSFTDPVWADLPGDVAAVGTIASKSDFIGAATQRFYQILLLP